MECKHLTAGQKFTSDFHICKEMYISYSPEVYPYVYSIFGNFKPVYKMAFDFLMYTFFSVSYNRNL